MAGKGWHGDNKRHVAAANRNKLSGTARSPMMAAPNLNTIRSDKPWMKLFYGAVLDYARNYFDLHEEHIELRFRTATLNIKKGQINLSDTENIITVQNGGIESNISFILHEFTHIKQKIRKEMTFEKRNNNWMLLWNGEPVISRADYTRIWKSDKEYNRYKALPWEAEAIELGKQVQGFFNSPQCQSLIGKDPSIDYILKNRVVVK